MRIYDLTDPDAAFTVQRALGDFRRALRGETFACNMAVARFGTLNPINAASAVYSARADDEHERDFPVQNVWAVASYSLMELIQTYAFGLSPDLHKIAVAHEAVCRGTDAALLRMALRMPSAVETRWPLELDRLLVKATRQELRNVEFTYHAPWISIGWAHHQSALPELSVAVVGGVYAALPARRVAP